MSQSPYEEMFGAGYVGRPRSDEPSVGLPTGDRKITEAARRRATRVLKVRHEEEFLDVMQEEVEFLMGKEKVHGQG